MAGLIPSRFERKEGPQPERREGPFELEKAYTAAREIIEAEAIDPRKLVGGRYPYNTVDVQRDMQSARDAEERIKRDPDEKKKQAWKLAKILEVAIHQQIQGGWFGADVQSILPSAFDDICGKIDLIIEFVIKEYSMTAQAALGIDVTYSDNDLRKKIHGILEEIHTGNLATIRYYKSRDGKDVGSKFKTPRVVLAMDEPAAKTIARAWFENNPALKTDPLRIMALVQIIDQCKAFEEYATRIGNKDAADSYRRNKLLFERVLGGPVIPQDRTMFGKDKVVRLLEQIINTLDK